MKNLFRIFICVMCILLVLVMAGSYLVFSMTFVPGGSLGSMVEFAGSLPDTGLYNDAWKAQIHQVTTSSEDGLLLSAYEYIHDPNARWVILIHGFDADATAMAVYADRLGRQGYNILAVDLRCHGNSQGKYCGFGVLDSRDILQWADYIESRTPGARIVLLGSSMGGGTALIAASLAPDRFEKVIADSVPTDYSVIFSQYMKAQIGPLTQPSIAAISLYCRIFAGYWLHEADPIRYMDKLAVPVLFTHGTHDGLVPAEGAQQLYDQCSAPKKLLLVENGGHSTSVYVNPRLFWDSVTTFLTD